MKLNNFNDKLSNAPGAFAPAHGSTRPGYEVILKDPHLESLKFAISHPEMVKIAVELLENQPVRQESREEDSSQQHEKLKEFQPHLESSNEEQSLQ